jgi:8-oxo-dGTP pyrophosphatase MutT (NUDIX family)
MEDSFHLGIKALIRNANGDILLLKTNPDQLKGYDGEPYWDIPGGRMERGSTVEETLKREIKEETGLLGTKSIIHIAMVLSNIRIPINEGDVGLILSIYSCEIENSSKVVLSSEHIDYKWFTPKEASEKLSLKYPKEFTDRILVL